MRYLWISLLVMLTMLFSTSGPARGEDDDAPFAEEQQGAEFRQTETKQQTGRLNPPAVVQPGPEAGPGASVVLLKDRLQVLEYNRADAVRQKKSPAEIAKLDAQINDIRQQLAPPQ